MYPSSGFLLLHGIFVLSLASRTLGDSADQACSLLTAALPGRVAQNLLNPQYIQDNEHWADSSSELSECTVEPASSAEVATIFNVINQTRTPWAVKGGGHAYNVGYSSTEGVQISLSKFNEITYNSNTSTAKIGAGNIWDDVYAALNPQGVNVLGGRVPGVGVAGFTLGGGYSWGTQQYGLTIDTVVQFDLVTPTGNILAVTEQSNPDLFFGLRGGGNNFGIVTAFTLQTHPQPQVFGGTIIYTQDQLSAITDAIVDFDTNNADPKAAILASYTFVALTLETIVFLFYDGPTPPNGTFDAFLNIPALSKSVKTQGYSDFVQGLAAPGFPRVAAHTVPIIQYTKPVIDEIINQTLALGLKVVTPGIGLAASLSIEVFTRNLYDHSRGGAYPHSPTHPWTPFQVLVAYLLPAEDAAFRAYVKQSADAIHQVAIQEGQSSPDAILYNNYAQSGTALELLYGENLPRLRTLRAQNDPQNLMNLTGGWRL